MVYFYNSNIHIFAPFVKGMSIKFPSGEGCPKGGVGLTLSKKYTLSLRNSDPRKPMDPSGVRLGTAAITTRGFDIADTQAVAKAITQAIENHKDEAKLKSIRESILELCRKRALYK